MLEDNLKTKEPTSESQTQLFNQGIETAFRTGDFKELKHMALHLGKL